ncbi:flavodoxin [Ignavigranum ruoffiae]|uniref:Flavodoxin, short chain n=1 Tax=Ignavigranum ruoffiae TaxID=89093 RepID=A0A1H9CGT0_9LACT|nr:flavodoxin [Ignavigranum ruoffiae]SEQ00261.1 flavodoxin, short chain [Ignavigranum ruoffiae]
MTKALIVYASLTGNTEEAAEILGEALIYYGMEAHLKSIEQADVIDFLDYDICIVGSYTYGPGTKGELPIECQEFYKDLATIDLSEKYYMVFGSGDDFYPEWCTAVDDFCYQFQKTGAREGTPSYKFNLNPEEKEIEDLYERAKILSQNILEKE